MVVAITFTLETQALLGEGVVVVLHLVRLDLPELLPRHLLAMDAAELVLKLRHRMRGRVQVQRRLVSPWS